MASQSAQTLQFSDESERKEVKAGIANAQLVTFSCSHKNYGIDIMAVREIRSWAPVTEVPDQPRTVRGVLDIRGEVVPVVDLNLLLDGALNEVSRSHVVIIVSVAGASVGILVDAVSDIISVGETDMRSAPQVGDQKTSVVSGMAKHDDTLFSILDLTSLLDGQTSPAPTATQNSGTMIPT